MTDRVEVKVRTKKRSFLTTLLMVVSACAAVSGIGMSSADACVYCSGGYGQITTCENIDMGAMNCYLLYPCGVLPDGTAECTCTTDSEFCRDE